MNLMTKFNFFISMIFFVSYSITANEQPICSQNDNTQFISHDVFDLSEPDTIFLHHWANAIHIITKKKTLANESAFFLSKCHITEADLQELERHLRSKKYIRNAKVTSNDNKNITVETWDNWSLLPTLDFGRKGGKNKFGFGIVERNLLGLGIDADIEYFSNNQRTGYKLDSQFPLFLQQNINGSIRLTDSDDGSSQAFFIKKKFVSFDTEHAYHIGFDNFNEIDTQYENGKQANRFRHKQHNTSVSWHWLHNNSLNDTLRFGVGFSLEDHHFSSVLASATSDIATIELPTDRQFNYPYFSINYLQKDFRKLTNLNLINQIEDFNLGWNFNTTIGSDLSNRASAPTIIWRSNLSKGLTIDNSAFAFFQTSFDGELYDNNQVKDRLIVTINSEYFHKFNDYWGGYIQNISRVSKNQFLDDPIVLGGESGIRGFPLQYQHGKHSTQFSFEARYYPHINLYKLIELGAAAFIDTGKIFNRTASSKERASWMTAIGLGARLYSTHSSESRVIHFDIIKPLTSAANVNNIEFRITTKQTF